MVAAFRLELALIVLAAQMAKVEKREKGGWISERMESQEEKSIRSRDLVGPRPLTASRSQAGAFWQCTHAL